MHGNKRLPASPRTIIKTAAHRTDRKGQTSKQAATQKPLQAADINGVSSHAKQNERAGSDRKETESIAAAITFLYHALPFYGFKV